jgi:predicted nucleic acid-binding protein
VICVDASVAVKWILDEERTDLATTLYDDALRSGRLIVAPPLLLLEVTNILRQRMRGPGRISLDEALDILDDILAFKFLINNPAGLHRQALVLADYLGLPAAYDAHYLALAESLGCEFWTDDQRLLRQVGNRLPFVRWLGDYGVPAAT